jgi:hypothetical protein
MKTTFPRKRLWVDPPFQGRLLLRLVSYLAIYTFVGWHLGFLFETARVVASGQPAKSFLTMYVEYIQRQLPMVFAFAVLLPPLLYDLLKFSNRVAGPLFRCRRVMREMAAGAVVPEFTPRKGDFMGELFAAFNALIHSWNARAKAGAEAAAKEAAPAAGPDTPAETPRVCV